MSDENNYKPDPKVIATLANPVITANGRPTELPVVIPEIEGLIIRDDHDLQHITIQESNKERAAVIIAKQIETMVGIVNDLRLLAVASQSSYMFDTAGKISKNIIEGAKILYELEDFKEGPKKTVNNLNLSLTSDQINDLVTNQLRSKDPKKPYKNGNKK